MLLKLSITLGVVIALAVIMTALAIVRNNLPLTDPPGLLSRLNIYFSTNVAATSTDPPLPELETRTYPIQLDDLYQLSLNAIDALGWKLVEEDREGYRLHAVATSALFSFKDDIIIQLKPALGDQNAVHIHSSSRIGRGDLGTNSRHILNFYQALKQSDKCSVRGQRTKSSVVSSRFFWRMMP